MRLRRSVQSMPKLEFSQHFADGLAKVTSEHVESQILACLDSLERFGGMGSPNVPASIQERFGDVVRYIAIAPFDFVYSLYPEQDLVRVEVLVPQLSVR